MDLLEYNASLMWNLVPFGSIILALLESSIKFLAPDMVLTLPLVKVKLKKYLLSHLDHHSAAFSKHYQHKFALEVII